MNLYEYEDQGLIESTMLYEADKLDKSKVDAIFNGVSSTKTIYAKPMGGTVVLVQVTQLKQSGGAIVGKSGLLSMLKVYTSKKTNKPHYYLDNYKITLQMNMSYIDQTPLSNADAKRIARIGGYKGTFKELDDAPDAVDYSKVDIKPIEKIKSLNEFLENTELYESSLSRILSKTNDSRCATLTSFRGDQKTADNKKTNSEMASALKALGYSYTQVQGNYVEDKGTKTEKVVKELSFFVQAKDGVSDDEFDKAIFKLGAKYNQDAVLIIPKGGKDAYLWGTSKTCEWLKYGEKSKVGNLTLGSIKTEFFSKIGGRAFEFRGLTEATLDEKVLEPMTTIVSHLQKQAGLAIVESLNEIEIPE